MRRWSQRALLAMIDGVAARPRLVVVVAVLSAALGLAYTLASLRIDTDTTDMISADVPFRQHAIAFREAFPRFTNPIVAVIDGQTPERVQAAALALADALRADDAHFSAVSYPQGEPFFARNGLLYLEVEALGALTDELAAAQPLLAALADDPTLRGLAAFTGLALEHQAGGALPEELDALFGAMAAAVQAQREGVPREVSWRNLLDQDEPAVARQLVLAQPRLDYASLAPASQAITALRAAAERLRIDSAHGLQLRLTGGAVLEDEELQSAGAGAVAASVLSMVLVALLLLWGLRSWRLIVATMVTLVVGLIYTAAFSALAIGRLNLISITFAVLFVGLGVDFGIHVALRYQEKLVRASTQLQAIERAAQSIARALTLTALCAALGFLSFVPTAYLGLAELGLISAFGMLVAWLTSLTLLPALLCLMPLRTAAAPRRGLLLPIERHARPILAVAAIAGLASLLTLPDLEFDFNPLNLKDPTSESVVTFQMLKADPENSPHAIDILAPSLAEADRIARDLAEQPLVGRTVTLSSFVPEAQDEKLLLIDSLAWSIGPLLLPGEAEPLSAAERAQALEDLRTALAAAVAGDLAAEHNPGAAALVEALRAFAATSGGDPGAQAEIEARLLGLLPALLDDLRQALEAEPVSFDSLPDEIRERWLTPDGQARVLVQPAGVIEGNAELRAFAEAVLAEVPHATGAPILVVGGGSAVVDAFLQASTLTLVLITLLLALVLRNVRDILLVLAPIGLAALLTAASAVLLGQSVNYANLIALPLLFGLGVSGAIHVVVRQRQIGDVGSTSTPRAVVFSTLTMIVSFGSLALSSHPGLASMGLLLTLAILWSMICCLVVLPALLTAASGQRLGEVAQASDPAA